MSFLYDTYLGNVRYRALPPKDISFVPLKKDRPFNGEELMEELAVQFYARKHYLTTVFVLFRKIAWKNICLWFATKSATRCFTTRIILCFLCHQLSIVRPTLISFYFFTHCLGEYTKIELETKNIFIEATGTDLKKLEIVLDTLVTMFGQYCRAPFT